MHLALGLGLRREEVLGLRWSDVDDAVHVRQTLTAAQGALHIGPPKSKAGRRDLPMPAFVSKALGRTGSPRRSGSLPLGLPRPELVVSNAIGQPYQPATFSGDWRDFAEAHGFDGITFHGLRHGAATLLLAAGVSDAVAMRTMGHADTRILARYQDVVVQRDAASRMDPLLGGESSELATAGRSEESSESGLGWLSTACHAAEKFNTRRDLGHLRGSPTRWMQGSLRRRDGQALSTRNRTVEIKATGARSRPDASPSL